MNKIDLFFKDIDNLDIKLSYLYLKKQISYENNVLLYLKKQIANFEEKYQLNSTENNFEEILKSNFNKIMIEELLTKINFKKIIKKVEETSLESKIFTKINTGIKNIEKEQEINKIIEDYFKEKNNIITKGSLEYNYIIDCPIELHILSILWILKVGIYIDEDLSKHTYAFRLDEEVKQSQFNRTLFKKYSFQYQQYRNNGLKKYQEILEIDKENAIFINIDLKKFYYSINKKILHKIELDIIKIEDKYLKNNGILTKIMFSIIRKYSNKVKLDKNYSKKEMEDIDCLPIGLYASPIISNFILKPLDEVVINKISPSYYGRYVDDMFFIFKESLEKKFFLKDKYFKKKMNPVLTKIKKLKLEINEYKTKIEYSNPHVKNSNIEVLKQQLNEQTSTFSLLTNEEDLRNLYKQIMLKDEKAELKDSKYNISVYLAKLLYKYELVSDLSGKKEFKKDMKDFLSLMTNLDILKYNIFLEKIFLLLIMGEFCDLIESFYKRVLKIIDELEKNDNNNKFLKEFLKDSFLFSLSLNPTLKINYLTKEIGNNQIDINKELYKIANSNMFNRAYINYPLLNYLNFSLDEYLKINFLRTGYFNVLKSSYKNSTDILNKLELNENKINLTPRFIHLNLINIFYIKKSICSHQFNKKNVMFEDLDLLSKSKNIFKMQFNNFKNQDNNNLFEKNLIQINQNIEYNFNYFKVISQPTETNDILKVGVASISIDDKSILNQLSDIDVLSLSKKEKIIFILNQAKINKVNLLIFSELSIPIELLKMLSEFSRINNIIITGGLEYIICDYLEYNSYIEKFAYNCLFTILPFKYQNIEKNTKYITSFIRIRLKNDYAPGEQTTLLGRRFSIPKNLNKKYDLFSWNGVFFTNFNCFELSDINARGLFKNYVDLVIASVFNKDLPYFKNIIDSTTRDLHSYIVQSNTALYGDSLIQQPTKKDYATLGIISGGITPNLLINNINIKKLREFQLFDLIEQEKRKNEFKFTPPGIDPNIVKLRINNNLEQVFSNSSKFKGILEQDKENSKFKLTFFSLDNLQHSIENIYYTELIKEAKEWIKENRFAIKTSFNDTQLKENQILITIQV
ncbi:RNA-directed DNA polymerase [Cetobacterium sp.]|uniref:RNA-directed DNA polymerase n=1 Tax=Cetobacterium sp. TaxID=2071632 RepID=UPI002FC7A103